MEIPNKYLGLIDTLIYDKRTKTCGMISDLSIMSVLGRYIFAYIAFMDDKLHSNTYIFPEDFEKGNIVFLMPYDTTQYSEEMDGLRKNQRKAIQEFFGDKFREDMLMEISEEERQKEIKEWEKKRSCFELCWSKNRHKRDIARVKWAGVFGTEQEFDHKRYHPTQKPIKLAEWFLKRYSKDGHIIIDLFGGSGSTLIACEQLDRTCYMMELDPHYCDVIIKRWETLAGEKAIKLN